MKNFIVGLLVGSLIVYTGFNFFVLPALKHSGNFDVGVKAAQHEIISKIEAEFGSTESVESDTQVLFSTEEKTVLIKERSGIKTLEVYKNNTTSVSN